MERQTSACRQGVRLHQRGGEGNGEAAVEEEGGCECRGAWALEMSETTAWWRCQQSILGGGLEHFLFPYILNNIPN